MQVLFDANVLITGVFVPYSQSRKVLSLVQDGKISGFVCQNTIEEADTIIRRAYDTTGLNLLEAFSNAISQTRLIVLPRVTKQEGEVYIGIRGKGDKSLFATANKCSLVICTNDLQDFANAHKYGVVVLTPDKIAADGTEDLNRIVMGFLASPSQGTIKWTPLSRQ